MSIVPLAHTGLGIGNAIVAVTPKDVLALTTSAARAKNLVLEGYTFTPQPSRNGDVVYKVQGPDEVKRTGTVIKHGPYLTNVSAQTCTCPAFCNRGACPHIEASADYHAGKRPRRAEVKDKQLWALREVGGDRLRIERDDAGRALVLTFRSSGLALDEAQACAKEGEELELIETDLSAIMADGRYGGIRTILREKHTDVLFGVAPNTNQIGRAPKPEPPAPPANPWGGWREDVAAAIADAPEPAPVAPVASPGAGGRLAPLTDRSFAHSSRPSSASTIREDYD